MIKKRRRAGWGKDPNEEVFIEMLKPGRNTEDVRKRLTQKEFNYSLTQTLNLLEGLIRSIIRKCESGKSHKPFTFQPNNVDE